MRKAKIIFEVTNFLKSSGISASRLAKESGVNVVYIWRLVNGKQNDILSDSADRIRDAMLRLSPNIQPLGKEGSDDR